MPDITHASAPGPSPRHGGRFTSLRWRILVWISIVALGPLVIMAAQGYHCARQAVIESQENHLRAVVEYRRERLESQIAERRTDLRFLSTLAAPYLAAGEETLDSTAGFERESREFLDMLEGSQPSVHSVMLFDGDWNCAARTGEEPCDAGALLPGFREDLAVRGAFTVGPSRMEADGNLHFPVGVVVAGAGGSRLGYLVAELDLSPAEEPVFQDRAGLGRTGKVYLVSPDGAYLVPPRGDASLIGRSARLPRGFLSRDPSSVPEYVGPDSVPVIGASTFVPGPGWFVVAEIDRAEAFSWLSVLQRRALFTGFVTILIVVLASVTISQRLSRPLRELAGVARKVARGRHHERVGSLRGSEAREVALAFNTMLDELEVTHQRLVHAASLAAVGQLSSSIVHEMRNPLSSVKMNLQALRRKVGDDPAYAELADIAAGQAARLEKMASDLLGYGKPLELQISDIRFSELAAEVRKLVPGESAGKNVRLEISTADGDPEFPGDPEQLRQALTNLVLNALQVSPESGTVTLAAREVPPDGGWVEITVADHGPGLPEGGKDRLFQPFFTARPGGTGLGLANVRKIVEYHGGSVSAADRPGGGAVFTIRLPRRGTAE